MMDRKCCKIFCNMKMTRILFYSFILPLSAFIGQSFSTDDYEECIRSINGKDYLGKVNVTISGRTCQRWDTQEPHDHNFIMDSETENYCRNPDYEPKPWCYTTDPDVRFEFCDIPYCDPEECIRSILGIDYRGKVNVTISGKTCQRWDTQEPHNHKNDLDNSENYCRNPDYEPKPWCYTTDPNTRFELCDIPYCGCPIGWTEGIIGSMCYRYIGNNNLTYADAKDLCRKEGGYMVMPKTLKEDTFLNELITISLNSSTYWRAWIGATDTDVEGKWLWEDEEPLSYSNWGSACPEGWLNGKDGSLCYKYLPYEELDYTDTLDRCRQEGGHIIMPKTSAEDLFLEEVISNAYAWHWYRVWIGLTDKATEGHWVWEDNEPLTYSRWDEGQPDDFNGEDCAAFSRSNSWNDDDCSKSSTMTVCQRERIICTNGTQHVNSTGNLVEISGYVHGDHLNYSVTCEPPSHKVYGDLTRMCTEYGTWSGKEPECKKITCLNAIKYSNSSGTLVSISGHEYNDTLAYACELPYYKLIDGDLTRTCTENGIWSGKEPVCEQITCPNPNKYSNSSGTLVSISGYEYNDTLTYTCELPYKLIDGDLTRTCTENGIWSGKEPVCEQITCSNANEYSNNSGTLVSISGYGYNDTLSYACDPTYYKLIDGDLTRTCTENGIWSGKEPVCEQCMCPCRDTKSNFVLTQAQFEEMIKEMKVNPKNTSKAARRKTSAKDDRLSAKATGYVGIIILVTAGLVIIVPDIPVLFRKMRIATSNIF